jgi:precorrin-8X/cobalt-precorrin-8 methylmutase
MPVESLLERYGLPPGEIERLSLRRLEETAGDLLPADHAARQVALRVLYAAGDPGLAPQLRLHAHAVTAGVAALRRGARVVVDVGMVAAGLHREPLARLGCPLVVAIQQPEVAAAAAQAGISRAAAGLRLLLPGCKGSIVVIGNAPTALLALLDGLDAGAPPPALIVGMPVGLVAAAESKAELLVRDVPYVTVLGSRGGSPLAAAGLNALVELALLATQEPGRRPGMVAQDAAAQDTVHELEDEPPVAERAVTTHGG